MAPRSRVTVALGLLSVAQGARTKRHSTSSQASVAGIPISNYRADAEDFIMMFKPGTDDATIEAFCQGRCSAMGHPSAGGVAFAQIHGYEEMAMVANARADVIDLVEADGEVYMIPELDVSEVNPAVLSWGLERVGAPDRAFTGVGVNIYVQDTGVRVSHQDFGGRANPGIDLTQGGLKVCDGDTSCSSDVQGHGTHCAGTAAGTTFGVAVDAIVYAVKTLSDQGGGQRGWQISALDWMATEGDQPGVISMSLGGSGVDLSYQSAIGAASTAGFTVVVASGNSNSDACGFSPAFAEMAITVGATDSNDVRASYSNYGTCMNIMAPGSAITSAGVGSDTGTLVASGTSMACPHVSGGAALLMEENPTITRDQVLDQLKANARKDFISSLMETDPTDYLWVSGNSAPPSGPTQPPIPIPECRRRIWCR